MLHTLQPFFPFIHPLKYLTEFQPGRLGLQVYLVAHCFHSNRTQLVQYLYISSGHQKNVDIAHMNIPCARLSFALYCYSKTANQKAQVRFLAKFACFYTLSFRVSSSTHCFQQFQRNIPTTALPSFLYR